MPTFALVAIVVLVLVNGFFVAAEFALVSIRAPLPTESLRGKVARNQHAQLDEYLAACQLGITIASLALGALGEPTLAKLLEPVLHSLPLAHLAAATASILALLAMTALHITVGEQAPKSFAIGSAERVAMLCAFPLEGFHRALRPLVRVLNAASNGLVRLFGGTPASSHGDQASLEELRRLIGGLTRGGNLAQAEASILQGAFRLWERRAADVMTPRTRITSVRASSTVAEALVATRGTGHSRFPVVEAEGELLGVVYTRELADAVVDGAGEELVETRRRAMLVAPPTQPLDVLLARMQDARTSICAVIGEYGGLEGVVSVEDILEEIVGEIWDEDDAPASIRRLDDGRIVCPGDTSLLDLADYGVEIRDVQSGSIGGAIIERLDHVPEPGETVSFDGVQARVLASSAGRVLRVMLFASVAT